VNAESGFVNGSLALAKPTLFPASFLIFWDDCIPKMSFLCYRKSSSELDSSSSPESLSAAACSIKTSHQRGSLDISGRLIGLKRVFLGSFLFPFFLLRLIMRFLLFYTLSIIPSSLSMKLFHSSPEMAPPISSLREWYGS